MSSMTHPDEVGAASSSGLSVVIPVRNAARTLGEQLDALLAAEHPDGDLEVIVSDNGSTDDTASIVAMFESRLPVRMIDASASRGSNYARNCGVRDAHYDRILLCDGDDRVDRAWLTVMSAAFDQGHRLIAGSLDYLELNDSATRVWRGSDRAGAMVMLGFLPSGHGANLGFTKSLWQELGGFDEAFEFGGPDVEFCWRAQLAGTPLRPVPDAVVHYRLRPSLSALFKQSRAYGAAEAHLFREFEQFGMNRRPATAPFRELWWHVSRLPFAVQSGRRGAWVRRIGQQVGRFEGAVRYKVIWW